MPRRRTVVLISAAAVLALGLLAVAVVVIGIRTAAGRDVVRRYVLSELSTRVHGKVYLGRFHGSLFGDITIDSIELRESNDSLFFASGPISLRFRPGDLFDRRIRIAFASVTRPIAHVRQDSAGDWNFRKIFPSGPPRAPSATRGFGDYIVLDSLRMRGAAFALTQPWQPDDTLRGYKRDSVIAYNLTRKDREYRRTGWGFTRTFRWTKASLDAGYVRIAEPDSVGQFFTIHRLDVDEQVPPFKFSKLRGTVRLAGDTVFPEIAHFELPGSRGRGRGTVSWGREGPPRYDLRIIAEHVALADINWVYPTLPRDGGGSVRLNITNARDPDIMDYELKEMDVRSGNSRLRGAMTFGVGGPILEVRDLDLEAAPVDFALLEGLAGEPFPYPWRGTLHGTVQGSGGPLNDFIVEDANIEFRDANVAGAVTKGTARGGLDISEPSLTAFKGFDVELEQLDLRTLQFLEPDFPRLNGMVSGKARLDSTWTDVRFSNADLTHRDGASPPSRFLGNGRVAVGEQFLTYDMALTADSLSFTTFAKSYPGIRLRGEYAGPMRINGTLADLSVTATLHGSAGTLGVDGTLDASKPGYGFAGLINVAALDLRTLLDTTAVPRTSITGQLMAELQGDSTLGSLTGRALLELDRSLVDSVRIYPSRAQFRFADGRARVDTFIVESAAGRLEASGGLGLTNRLRDSLRFAFSADSLGAFRRYLTARGDTLAGAVDSLLANIDARGTLTGSVDSFTVSGRLEARAVRALGQRARLVRGDVAMSGFPKNPQGTANIAIDTAVVAGVSLVGGDVHMALAPNGDAQVTIGLESMTGPTARGVLRRTAAGDSVRVAIDSLRLRINENTWDLERPTSVTLRNGDVTLMPLTLLGGDGTRGRISVSGVMPDSQPMDMRVAIDSVTLADLGTLAQTRLSMGGRISMRAAITGTRAAPLIDLSGQVSGAEIGEFRIARGDLTGSYRDRSLTAKLSLFREAALVLTADATLPIDLAFERRGDRTLDIPLRGTIRSSDVDLALLESFTPMLQRATGRFNANLDLEGTWDEPRFTGSVRIANGAFSWTSLGAVRMRDANADIAFHGDSVHINRLVVVSGRSDADSAWMRGWVEFSDTENPSFDINIFANNFEAISNRRTAELTLSGQAALRGALRASALTGRVVVDEGVVYIPELARKDVISLDDPSVVQLIDTSLFVNRSLLPRAPPTLVRNLTISDVRIVLGDDVWLRSREANIKLQGSLDVTKGTLLGTSAPQLALEGVLETVRGTYVLDIAGVVRRLFDVESGTLRFFGEPDFNPTLNIRAVHTVAVLGATDLRNEARIRVILEGTLARPSIRLESADGLRYSQSDLLSLLVTGAPSLQQGATAYNAYLSSFLGLLTSGPTARLREALSLDLFSIRSGVSGNDGGSFAFGDLLLTSTLGIGKQVGERSFVTLSYGLCALRPQTNTLNLAETLGLRFEHRLEAGFGLSLSREPASQSATCGITGTRTFTATPPQYGIDLFRAWRY